MTAPSLPAQKKATKMLVLVGGLVLAAVGTIAWFWLRPGPPPMIPPLPEASDHLVAQALEEAYQMLRAEPHSAQAWGNVGLVLYGNDFNRPAAPFFAQAEQLDPDDPRWPYFQALIFINHDLAQAEPCLRRTLRTCTTTETPRFRLAETLFGLGKFDEAERLFVELVTMNPGHPWACLGLGRLYHQRGQLDTALSYLLQSARDPGTAKASYQVLAVIYQAQNRPSLASQALQQERQAGPEFPPTDPLANEATAKTVGQSLFQNRFDEFLNAKRFSDADDIMEKWTWLYPESRRAHYFMGRLQLARWNHRPDPQRQNKDYQKAEKHLLIARTLDPGKADILFLLARVYELQHDYAKAVAFYQEAQTENPRDHHIHYNLALCFELMGDSAAALATWREGLKVNPDSTLLHGGIAAHHITHGRFHEALIHYGRGALNITHDLDLTNRVLGLALFPWF